MSGTWGGSLEDLRGQGVEPQRTREGVFRWEVTWKDRTLRN